MEFILPELLSREDILKILNERQLPVQNMNELTHEQLLRIYKNFAMPLSRRPERNRKPKQDGIMHTVNRTNGCGHEEMEIEPLVTATIAMDIDFAYTESCNAEKLVACNRMSSPVGEKRRQRSSDEDYLELRENDYQFQLSSDTKRIRINSLS